MNTSKGRDKFCQLLQYSANFYVTCMKDSPQWRDAVKRKEVRSVLQAKKIEDNISNGRKIFRLALFINEIEELNQLLKNKKLIWPVRILKILSHLCSFLYYFFDNVVWLQNFDFVDKRVWGSNVKWKNIKDFFSLWKTVLEVIISNWLRKLKEQKEKILLQKLEVLIRLNKDRLITENSEVHALIRKIIITRRKSRFLYIETIIYTMRMIMLTSALKLVGHAYLDPIFVSLCGLCQAGCTVFKSMKGKKRFVKLTIESKEEETKTMIVSQTEYIARNRSNSKRHSIEINRAEEEDDFFGELGESGTTARQASKVHEAPGFTNVSAAYRKQPTQIVDDVYDEQTINEGYTLKMLRPAGTLDFMKLMACDDEAVFY